MPLDSKKECYTVNEIFGQPKLWNEVYEQMIRQQDGIAQFLGPILQKKDLRIILTGAGSSAFIGQAAEQMVEARTGKITQAIATTDLATHYNFFLSNKNPILLVSLARSGNSPESSEVFSLAEQFCEEVYHLIITCDGNGNLANCVASPPNSCYKIILPEEANDKSLAMTGSFTSMLLCLLLVWKMDAMESERKSVETMISLGEAILKEARLLEESALGISDRVVFLGSGPSLGIARECHLKLQELTNGQVICKFDSFLGFRHGPMAVINENTLMVYLFSDTDHVFKYERDLVESISADPRNIRSISFKGRKDFFIPNSVAICKGALDKIDLTIVSAALIGQLLGLYRSLQLNLNPDNPSENGIISRVVKGVTIYKE